MKKVNKCIIRCLLPSLFCTITCRSRFKVAPLGFRQEPFASYLEVRILPSYITLDLSFLHHFLQTDPIGARRAQGSRFSSGTISQDSVRGRNEFKSFGVRRRNSLGLQISECLQLSPSKVHVPKTSNEPKTDTWYLCRAFEAPVIRLKSVGFR